MAKFYGKVGYATEEKVDFGDVRPVFTEYEYAGDVEKNSRQLQDVQNLNDDIKVNNRISILADSFAYQHFFDIRYVEWMGSRWKVANVEVARPRLILTLGGLWNG